MILSIIGAALATNEWSAGDVIQNFIATDHYCVIIEKNVDISGPSYTIVISGVLSTDTQANFEAAGWVRVTPSATVATAPPGFGVVVPTDTDLRGTALSATVRLAATSTAAAYVALKVEAPVAGYCDGTGAMVDVWRAMAPMGDVYERRWGLSYTVPAGCSYELVRGGAAGVVEAVSAFGSMDI